MSEQVWVKTPTETQKHRNYDAEFKDEALAPAHQISPIIHLCAGLTLSYQSLSESADLRLKQDTRTLLLHFKETRLKLNKLESWSENWTKN